MREQERSGLIHLDRSSSRNMIDFVSINWGCCLHLLVTRQTMSWPSSADDPASANELPLSLGSSEDDDLSLFSNPKMREGGCDPLSVIY